MNDSSLRALDPGCSLRGSTQMKNWGAGGGGPVPSPVCGGRSVNNGWILAEVVPALALAALFIGLLLQGAVTIRRCVGQVDRSVQMRQMLLATLWCIGRDVRMGGCNPLGIAGVEGIRLLPDPSGEEALWLEMDIRGSQPGSLPDGETDDPDERIAYRWDANREMLFRNGQPMATRIVKNPEGEPLFSLRREGNFALLSVFLSMEGQDGQEVRSARMAFFVRNRLE